LQALSKVIRYTFGFICYEIDLAIKYGRTAIIQLLVLRYFADTQEVKGRKSDKVYLPYSSLLFFSGIC